MARSFLKSLKPKKKAKGTTEQKDTSSPVPQIGGHRSAPPLPGPSKPVPLPVIGGHRKKSTSRVEQKDGSPGPQIGGHRATSTASLGTAPISEMQKWQSAKSSGRSPQGAPVIGRGRGLGASRVGSSPTPTSTGPTVEDVKDDSGPYNTDGVTTSYKITPIEDDKDDDATPYKYGATEHDTGTYRRPGDPFLLEDDFEDDKDDDATPYKYGATEHDTGTYRRPGDPFLFEDDFEDDKDDDATPYKYGATEHDTGTYRRPGDPFLLEDDVEDDKDDDATPYKYGATEHDTGTYRRPGDPFFFEDDVDDDKDDDPTSFKYASEQDLQATLDSEDDTDHDSEDDDEILYQNLADSPELKEESAPVPPKTVASKETPAVRAHRAWLIAKLSKDYEHERTIQRADLNGAASDLARGIKVWWDLIDELGLVDASEPDELATALGYAPKNHPIRTVTTVAEALEVARKMHAMLLEKARRQELPVTEDGVLGDISGRLVQYDDEAAQERSLVLVGGNKLFRNDEMKTPVDTLESSTFHSGLGAEIFVVGMGNEIHMASHKIGKFHHSSLLGGANVSMAGELAVTDGKVDWISNKSGHYTPSVVQFQQFLHHLGKDVPLSFPVTGWGVPKGLTAQQLVDGVDENGALKPKKSHDYLKTQEMLTAWKALVGKDAMKKVMRDHGWTLDKWDDEWEVEDADNNAVPPPSVRQAMKDAFPDKKPVGEK